MRHATNKNETVLLLVFVVTWMIVQTWLSPLGGGST
jgi:hypothetical protein